MQLSEEKKKLEPLLGQQKGHKLFQELLMAQSLSGMQFKENQFVKVLLFRCFTII